MIGQKLICFKTTIFTKQLFSLFQDIEYDEPQAIAEPVFSGYFARRIGWLCGEPMPDYAHVVFRSKM